MSWSILPNEILLNIFQRNDNNTNSQCSLTCHDWKYTAQCILFEKIPIMDEEKLDVMSKALSIYQHGCTGFDQSPGNYVKIVNGQSLSHTFDWKQLDRLFPFLEVIETDRSMNSAHNKIYKLLKEGKFPHLKQLPTTEASKPPPELLLDRREKIEELKLYSTSLEDKVLQNLNLFTNLKRLELNYSEEVHLEHFFSKEIVQLKSINITFEENFKSSVTSLLDINNIQPFPNVREMKVEYHHFFYDDDKYLLYIMKKFPNLSSLELDDREYYIGDRCGSFTDYNYEIPTMRCQSQFLKYLFKMKYSKVACIITDDFTTQIIKNFLAHIIDLKFVHSKNIEVSLIVKFHIATPEHLYNYHPDRNTYIEVQNEKAGYKDYKEDQCNLSVVYTVLQETTFQSHLQLFREVGDLDITFLLLCSQTVGLSKIPIVLDEVFYQFSKLKDLVISNISNFIWNKEERPTEEIPDSNIENMLYRSCVLSKDIFPIISKRCQNLKILILENCLYTNNNEVQANSRYFPIFMPSTSLEELQISLDNSRAFQYKKAFIRLITNNKKPRYCKFTTHTNPARVTLPEIDCTEAHYNTCLHDEKCGVFDIHCGSVKKLTVEFETDDFGPALEFNSDNEEVWDEEEECISRRKKEYLEEDL